MDYISLNQSKKDPSSLRQTFADLKIDLHCSRYWKLEEWECQDMAFPFWRLYYNSISGASVYFNEKKVDLDNKQIIVIPPGTSFSTRLKTSDQALTKESIVGYRLENSNEVRELAKNKMVDHLFIHFNLGYEFDKLEPDIYSFPVDKNLESILEMIKLSIIDNPINFNILDTAIIHSFIINLLIQIPLEKWFYRVIDSRVLNILRYIDNNLNKKLENYELAKHANMAVNSFSRLFRKSTSTSIQQYIQKKRIEKSLDMLHHTLASIEEIAEKCGFCDRFHFSRIFKKQMNSSPSTYRKKLTIQLSFEQKNSRSQIER